jgi:hypothetical protein
LLRQIWQGIPEGVAVWLVCRKHLERKTRKCIVGEENTLNFAPETKNNNK